MHKYYYVYKITNRIDGKIYIGCHQTTDMDDGYMGSGKYLVNAQKKYGIDNFDKTVLHTFDTPEEMFLMESALVNDDFVQRDDTYNIITGGNGSWSHTKGTVLVRDSAGNKFKVHRTDPRYMSKELVPFMTGLIPVRDKSGNVLTVSTSDPRLLSGELRGMSAGKVVVKDRITGNRSVVSVDDPKYINGEVVHVWEGRKHSMETRHKIGKRMAVRQIGSGNSMYGTRWIHNLELKKSTRIKKSDLLPEGWKEGRKQKF